MSTEEKLTSAALGIVTDALAKYRTALRNLRKAGKASEFVARQQAYADAAHELASAVDVAELRGWLVLPEGGRC